MLIAVHFPLADVRRFIPDVKFPAWPLQPPTDFIRAFGPARERRKQNTHDRFFPGEDVYCDVRRAVRFESPLRKGALGSSKHVFVPYCAHRRLLGDSLGAMRVEVGIGCYARSAPRNLSGGDLSSLLRNVFELPVSVHGKGKPSNCRLVRSGSSIARAYLWATTIGEVESDAWWVTPCRPLCLVVYDPSLEVATLPNDARRLLDINPPAAEGKPPGVSASNESVPPTPAAANATAQPPFGVSHLNMDCSGMTVRVLFLASPPNAVKDLNDWRRLRIHLARVHTERECLKQVLRFLDADRLQFAGYEPAHYRVKSYLDAVFSRLNRPTFDGLPQDSLARAMEDQSDAITEEMRDRVLGQMASARQALQAKAQTALATKGPVVNYNFEKEVVMTGGNIGGSYNQKVVVGPGGTIQGSVANGVIQDSFKSIESSDANDELKTELKKLTAIVQDMVGHLDETQAKRAANQLKSLTDEATAPNPDPKWYSISSKGLLQAAEFAGEFASKIGASLASITTLLGF